MIGARPEPGLVAQAYWRMLLTPRRVKLMVRHAGALRPALVDDCLNSLLAVLRQRPPAA